MKMGFYKNVNLETLWVSVVCISKEQAYPLYYAVRKIRILTSVVGCYICYVDTT